MSLYNNIIRNLEREEAEDENKIGYETWETLYNLPGIKQTLNWFEESARKGQILSEYQRSEENKNLLTKGLAWTSYGLEQVVGLPFRALDAGLEAISDRTNLDKRTLYLGLDIALAGKQIKGSKTGAYNRGFQTRQYLDKNLNKLSNYWKPASRQIVDIPYTSSMVDDIFKMNVVDFNLAKRLTHLSSSEYWYSDGDLNLRKGGITDPLRNDTNKFLFTEGSGFSQQLDLFGKSERQRLTAPSLFIRRMQQAGFRKNESGNYFIDESIFNGLTTAQQRDYAQLFQTDLTQATPFLFKKTSELEVPKFNEKYEAYLNKYGGKPEVHHIFPSALSMKFWLNEEYMGDNWYRLKEVANEYNLFPGEPSIEGQSNLLTLPSAIGKNDPNYTIMKERFGNVPSHLHNIVHNEILTNIIGQRGGKFFTKETLAKMNSGIDGKIEVFRDWNEILQLHAGIVDEALTQLDVLFSTRALSENPEKLTSMLEEYFGTGDIKIGSSIIKDRKGNIIMEDGKPKIATYSQFAVKDLVANSLADFTNDAKAEILGIDPKWKEVELEVAKYTGLSEAEIELAEQLLYDIKWYNSMVLSVGRRRAQHITGITIKQHKENIERYYDLIQLKLPLDIPTDSRLIPQITTPEALKTTTFKNTQLPDLNKQLDLIFDD